MDRRPRRAVRQHRAPQLAPLTSRRLLPRRRRLPPPIRLAFDEPPRPGFLLSARSLLALFGRMQPRCQQSSLGLPPVRPPVTWPAPLPSVYPSRRADGRSRLRHGRAPPKADAPTLSRNNQRQQQLRMQRRRPFRSNNGDLTTRATKSKRVSVGWYRCAAQRRPEPRQPPPARLPPPHARSAARRAAMQAALQPPEKPRSGLCKRCQAAKSRKWQHRTALSISSADIDESCGCGSGSGRVCVAPTIPTIAAVCVEAVT